MKENEFSIGDAISSYLQEIGIRDRLKVEAVIEQWSRIMGQAIAANTSKLWYKDGVLHVQMSNPTWRMELGMAKSKIKEVLNREMGQEIIQEVRIL